jgi:hypothetical protein
MKNFVSPKLIDFHNYKFYEQNKYNSKFVKTHCI